MILVLKYLYLCPEGCLIVSIFANDWYRDVLFCILVFVLLTWGLQSSNLDRLSHSVMIFCDSGCIICVF